MNKSPRRQRRFRGFGLFGHSACSGCAQAAGSRQFQNINQIPASADGEPMSSRPTSLLSYRLTLTRRTLRTWFARKCQSLSIVTLVTASSLGFNSQLGQAQSPPPAPSQGNQQFLMTPSDYSGSISGKMGMDYDASLRGGAPIVIGGSGIKARAGHEAGDNVGRDQAITYMDLSPYMIQDNWIFYGEGRLAIGNNGKTGGSLGLGLRRYFERTDSILGVNAFYDPDNTRGALFQQWGVGAELLSQFLDVRTNWYFPYGDTYNITNETFEAGSQQFIDRTGVPAGDPTGSWLAFQRRVFTSTAMQGFDTLFTVPVPGDVPQQYNMEASAGFYHYNDADNGGLDDIWGWRARVDMDVMERLSHLYLEVTHDKTFKTNVIFGIDINYWHNLGQDRRVGGTQYNRLAEWVRRNRTVVTYDGSFLSSPELAINPRTNTPYVIYHVNTNNPGGSNATQSDPFGSLNAALAASGNPDIIFVHGNSVINTPVNINRDYLQVLGESNSGNIGVSVANLNGLVMMPRVTTGVFDNPLIENVVGSSAVQLTANHVRFAGFDIDNTTGGNAIEAIGRQFGGGGIPNVLQDIRIRGVSGGNGIYFADNTGNMFLQDIQIYDTQLDSFRVERGDANINFTGTTNLIDNTANVFGSHGYAVQILDANGSVNMSNVEINDVGGAGIKVEGLNTQASTAAISFGTVNLTGNNSAAGEGNVYIGDFNGSVTFSQGLTINQTGTAGNQDAFVVRNLAPTANRPNTGGVFVNGITTINNRTGHGILVEDLGGVNANLLGRVQFGGPVNMGAVQSGTDEAIQFDSSIGNLDFLDLVNINGSGGDGIAIRDIANAVSTNPARFRSANTITLSNIAGTAFNIENVQDTNFNVSVAGLTVNNRGAAGSTGTNGAGIRIYDFAGTGVQFGNVTINNQLGSNAIPIDIQSNDALRSRSTGSIAFSQININNHAGSVGVNVLNNGGLVALGQANVNVEGDTAVLLRDNVNVSIGGGTLTSTGAPAIVAETTALGAPIGTTRTLQQHNINLTAVNANGGDYGIYVDESVGNFNVTGVGTTAGSGGTITGTAIAGASFNDTNSAVLNNMIFTGNAGVGIRATDMVGATNRLMLTNLQIENSASQAILIDDVTRFELINSSLIGNGFTNSTSQIDYVARNRFDTTSPTSQWVRLVNNRIADAAGDTSGTQDMIRLRSLPAAPTSGPLVLQLDVLNNGIPGSLANLNNQIGSNRFGNAAALDLNWTGNVNSTISNNTFNLGTGANQFGLDLQVNGNANVTFSGNTLVANGNNATGMRTNFSGPSTLTVTGNGRKDENGAFLANSGFVFIGDDSVGFDFSMQSERSRIDFSDNYVLFASTAQNATAVRFRRLTGVGGNSSVVLSGNLIDLSPINSNVITSYERAFEFLDTRGVISLSGVNDNLVRPVGSIYVVDFLGLGVNQAVGTGASVNGIRYPF